jgi:hypothetical protein
MEYVAARDTMIFDTFKAHRETLFNAPNAWVSQAAEKLTCETQKRETYQKVNAKNRLPGPPFKRPRPIWTYSAVPMVPPIPMSWICLGLSFR